MSSKFHSSMQMHPDEILKEWMDLRKERPHTHDPEAAAILGVPEAALHASRVGRGAVVLTTDLRSLLTPLPEWRRVFVVNRTLFGVNIHSLKVESTLGGSATEIRLNDPRNDILIMTQDVHQCFYIEDQTEHGRSAGLAWFNQSGHVLGKILLRSRQGQEIAKPHFLKHALADQSRIFLSDGCTENGTFDHNHSQTTSVKKAIETVQKLLLRTSQKFSMVRAIAMHSQGMISRYSAPLSKSNATGSWVHASSVDFKCHLRLDAAVHAQTHESTTSRSHEICLIDALGGRLSFDQLPEGGDHVVSSAK